jgi:hypothetical protein
VAQAPSVPLLPWMMQKGHSTGLHWLLPPSDCGKSPAFSQGLPHGTVGDCEGANEGDCVGVCDGLVLGAVEGEALGEVDGDICRQQGGRRSKDVQSTPNRFPEL